MEITYETLVDFQKSTIVTISDFFFPLYFGEKYRGLVNLDAFDQTFPTEGGSGVDGTILEGDMWMVNAAGHMYGREIQVTQFIKAKVDNPNAESLDDWDILGIDEIRENLPRVEIGKVAVFKT